jgi:YD repeat-containing protein
MSIIADFLPEGGVAQVVLNRFDGKGCLAERTTLTSGEPIITTSFRNDPEGRPVEGVVKDESGGTHRRTVWEYDPEGYLVCKRVYNGCGRLRTTEYFVNTYYS